MYRITVYISILLIFPFSLISQIEHQFSKAITDLINHYELDSIPGIAVGIVQDGAIIYENYAGYANLSHNVKISEKSRFNIASTAKQFTALMILRLSLEDKLDLEDDIRKYLPQLYPNVKEEIKIRHLITHSSGIRDYVELLGLKDKIWWKQMGLDNDDIMELISSQRDLGFEPGSQYSYSNSGYILLAEIIEAVSEQKFTEYSKEFFKMMGMSETYYVERYMGTIPNRAEPYYDWGNGLWLQTPTVTKVCGDGFLFTTLRDLLKYEQRLYRMTTSDTLFVLSQKVIPNSEITKYGYGLELTDWSGRKAVHHSGATLGYHSQMVRFQKEKLSIVVLSNNGNLRSDIIADSIASIVLPTPRKEPTVQYDSLYYKSTKSDDPPTIFGHYINDKGTVVRIVEKESMVYWKKENGSDILINKESDYQYAVSYDTLMKARFYKEQIMLFEPNGKFTTYRKFSDAMPTQLDQKAMIGTYYNQELEISFDLRFDKDNQLVLSFGDDGDDEKVNFLSNRKFVTESYTIVAEEDFFGRIYQMILSYGRAKNIRFTKENNLAFQSTIELDDGSIQVSTISSSHNNSNNILLTRNDAKGNEVWYKQFGGAGYDNASSILTLDDGYLIVGSTSSYGQGNYDVLIIKTDKKGNKKWQKTFGDHFNEYGYVAEITPTGFSIKGTAQQCDSKDVLKAECQTRFYKIDIDGEGNILREEILEVIDESN